MTHSMPPTYLPRADGTREVFCEMSHRKTRPCNGRARLDQSGILLTGVAVYFDTMLKTRFFCSRKCVVSYIRTYP